MSSDEKRQIPKITIEKEKRDSLTKLLKQLEDAFKHISHNDVLTGMNRYREIFNTIPSQSLLSQQEILNLLTSGNQLNIPAAQFFLGACYQAGWGVEINKPMAMGLYHVSSTANYALAQYTLATYYSSGEETLNYSMRLRELAAEQGLAVAQYDLGSFWCWSAPEPSELNWDDGVEWNWENGVKWFLLAAEQGYQPACLVIANHPKFAPIARRQQIEKLALEFYTSDTPEARENIQRKIDEIFTQSESKKEEPSLKLILAEKINSLDSQSQRLHEILKPSLLPTDVTNLVQGYWNFDCSFLSAAKSPGEGDKRHEQTNENQQQRSSCRIS